MEVVACGSEFGGEGKRFNGSGVEGVRVPFAYLDATVAEEELLSGNDEAVLMEGVAGDEEVGDAGFVFE